MANNKDSFGKTILVAVVVCLVASILVSAAAVSLKPIQKANQQLEKQRNILAVAGIDAKGAEISRLFAKNIEPKIVDIATGEFSDAVDVKTFDQYAAAKDPQQNVVLSADEDIAKIRSRAKYATIYLVKNPDDSVKYYILPINGYGLWSTMYGFVAIEPDADTIFGLNFYQQGETPGLGGEVDNPKWKAQWQGKKIHDANGDAVIQVVKFGQVNASNAAYTVDGLAGATLTSRGVNNLVHFWLGKSGFGKFLNNLKTQGASHEQN